MKMSRRWHAAQCVSIVGIVSVLWAWRADAASIGGQLKLKPNGGPTMVACTNSYDSLCPSGACECQEYIGTLSAHIRGLSGRGTADLFFTIDLGAATSVPDGCAPVFGNGFMTTPLGNLTINIMGALCDPTSTNAPANFSGGFGIAPGGAISSGFGTTSGALDLKTGGLSVTFKGVTP
jgi:hypothetical protein